MQSLRRVNYTYKMLLCWICCHGCEWLVSEWWHNSFCSFSLSLSDLTFASLHKFDAQNNFPYVKYICIYLRVFGWKEEMALMDGLFAGCDFGSLKGERCCVSSRNDEATMLPSWGARRRRLIQQQFYSSSTGLHDEWGEAFSSSSHLHIYLHSMYTCVLAPAACASVMLRVHDSGGTGQGPNPRG